MYPALHMCTVFTTQNQEIFLIIYQTKFGCILSRQMQMLCLVNEVIYYFKRYQIFILTLEILFS